MKMKKLLALALVMLMALGCLTACNAEPAEPTEEVVPVSKIELDSTELSMRVGDTAALTATVNLKATNKDLTWTSSDEAVVTVDAGTVTAVAAGEATVTATAVDGSGVSADCVVTVAEVSEALMTVAQDGEHPEPTDEISGDIKFNSDGTCTINAFYACLNAQIAFETTYAVENGVLTFGEPVAVEVMGVGGTVSTAAEVNGDAVTVVCTVIEQNVRCCEFTLSAEQIAQFALTVGAKTDVTGISVPESKTAASGTVFAMNELVTIEPADATVQDITVTVDESNAESQVVYVETVNIYPLEAGTVTITVSSVDNPEATATMTLTVEAVERPASLDTRYFDADRKFAWALNGYVFKTDGTVDILDKAGVLQVLGFYTLSEDGSQITLYALNDAAMDPNYAGTTYNLTKQEDSELLRFDVGEPLGVPGMYIAVETDA